MKELILEDLVGLHHLYGANYWNIDGCKRVDFILDGKNYTILEVKGKEYREDSVCAMLIENIEGFRCGIHQVIQVFCAHDNRRNNILDFYDIVTGKIIMSVGTEIDTIECGEVEISVFVAEINNLD